MNKEEKEAIEYFKSNLEMTKEMGKRWGFEEEIKNNEILLNLIQKQDKIIDKMAEKINQAYFDENNMWLWFEEEICSRNKDGKYDFKDLGTRKTRIKEYFKKVVDEDVKD